MHKVCVNPKSKFKKKKSNKLYQSNASHVMHSVCSETYNILHVIGLF